MSLIADVFPHDDPVARFVVAMSMARNDVNHAVRSAVKANAEDDPEFGYLVRLSYGHLVEGLEALGRWREHSPEVQRFLKGLPPDIRRKRVQAETSLRKVAKGAAQHARHRTFHYPSPNPRKQPDFDSELQKVLLALANEDATVTALADDRNNLRLYFADQAALLLAMGRHDTDPAKLAAEIKAISAGSVAFVQFVDAALAAYLAERQ